ncbi:MAG: DNA replication/repair protein RecF [Actinomycetota bacterium]|nr:DNA replication/repair protein RecF [Actinomycetota bacterium]
MYVAHLSLEDFRSFARADVPLEVGATVLVGPNGQGKTNLVEAIGYLATLASHRVATDAPLVRAGADRAVLRARVVRDGREALAEVEIVPGGTNRARLNRAPLPRPRELLGLLRTVVFAPEDLALVKGEPAERRRFLDQLLVTRTPRLAGVRADYDRVLRQRNSLLRTAGRSRRTGGSAHHGTDHGADLGAGGAGGRAGGALHTLDSWDEHLARAGAELVAERLRLVTAIRPLVERRHVDIAASGSPGRAAVTMWYDCSFEVDGRDDPGRTPLQAAMLAGLAARRADELDRGTTLVGPHRDELRLGLGDLPTRGYASHGEAWSLALSLRLAAYDLLRADGDDPVLVLDDVFAELDADRREHLAKSVLESEQVLVTAAVAADVPPGLTGPRFDVLSGQVSRAR